MEGNAYRQFKGFPKGLRNALLLLIKKTCKLGLQETKSKS